MCIIKKDFRPGYHPQVGYKTAIKRDGKYYSMFTGVEYKVGRVKQPDYGQFAIKLPFLMDVLHDDRFYMRDYIGLTAVFKRYHICHLCTAGIQERLEASGIDDVNIVTLEMKLGGIKFSGTYEFNNGDCGEVWMGTMIRSITELNLNNRRT